MVMIGRFRKLLFFWEALLNLRHCSDRDLLAQIKLFAQTERDVLIKILHHLREIDRRRLFCDLNFSSLFDYCVKELGYSEGQACRRIQAMRLIKDIPEIEAKIASGALNLSNVQLAQTHFRELEKETPGTKVSKNEKLAVLKNLENKSFRDGQREISKVNSHPAPPKESVRPMSEGATEIKFLMAGSLKEKLDQVRSLLGTKGANMTYAELFDAMADLCNDTLKAQRFGKRRAARVAAKTNSNPPPASSAATPPNPPPASSAATKGGSRYISKAIKFQVWQRDGGLCTNCKGAKHLNYDHIHPFALGGPSTVDNLRLLCFACNQRASNRTFGIWEPKSPSVRKVWSG